VLIWLNSFSAVWFTLYYIFLFYIALFATAVQAILQCFDAVGQATRMASGVVDRFKTSYVEFIQDSVYQKLLILVYFYSKNENVATFWDML